MLPAWLCSLEAAVYAQGALVAAALGAGWGWAGVMRRRERLRRCGGGHKRHEGAAGALPAVTVIMPVKGCRDHSEGNWASHVGMQYDGPIEFLFTGESAADSAWPVLQRVATAHPRRTIRLHVAGLSTTCAQKLHNLASAAKAASPHSRYLLFLDDDVEAHPSTLGDLVATLEGDPRMFMATGYPFDIPPAGASLAAFCMLVYHLPLLIAISASQDTRFVWGGCMMLRADSLRPTDKYGVLQAWLDGGCSDDLILAGLCSAHNLRVAAPSYAIFAQRLDKRISWGQYWNYLRRQLFVVDTYSSTHNRLVNCAMMVVSIYLSAAFAASVLMAAPRVAWHAAAWAHQALGPAGPGAATAPPTTAASTAAAAATAGPQPAWALHTFLALLVCAHLGLRFMTREVLALLRVLSPARAPVPCAVFSWPRVWAALLLQCLLMPWCMAYTLLHPGVVWAGVRYFKSGGKIVRVERAPTQPK